MKKFLKEIVAPYIALAVFVIVAMCVNAKAQPIGTKFYFSGAYKLTEILPALCENCRLDVPPEFSDTEIFLAVKSQEKKDLQNAVKSALAGLGYRATITNKLIRIEKDETKLVPYVSCLDTNLYEIPETSYKLRKYADSLKCITHKLSESERKKTEDSLRAIPPLVFHSYKLRYITLYKKFADKMGVDWNEILASGDLRKYPRIYDKWSIIANETNDTTFSVRELSFAFDSSFTLDWGSEKQIEKSVTISDGLLTTEKEWRKYGVQIEVTAHDSRVKLEYTFRNDDETTLSGQAVGGNLDTLKVYGDYANKILHSDGLPLLQNIPIFGNFFKVENTEKEIARFELYLIPVEMSSKK